MNEHPSVSLAGKGSSSFAQRGAPLSISTSKPHPFDAVEVFQSPSSKSALPQPTPHRTFSGPAAIPSSSTFTQASLDDKTSSPVTPRSAGYRMRNLRFEMGDAELKTSNTAPEMGRPSRDGIKRRHTVDPRVNIHTECGRHSDDWLFGGWNVADAVKKIWDKKEPKA